MCNCIIIIWTIPLPRGRNCNSKEISLGQLIKHVKPRVVAVIVWYVKMALLLFHLCQIKQRIECRSSICKISFNKTKYYSDHESLVEYNFDHYFNFIHNIKNWYFDYLIKYFFENNFNCSLKYNNFLFLFFFGVCACFQRLFYFLN